MFTSQVSGAVVLDTYDLCDTTHLTLCEIQFETQVMENGSSAKPKVHLLYIYGGFPPFKLLIF